MVNIRGLGESTKLNIVLALTDLMTQIALVVLGTIVILDPGLMIRQVHLGVAPSYTQLLFAVSISMIAYTGNRDRLQHGRGGEGPPSEERLLGPTTRHVLAHRPCRVIVEHDAQPTRRRSATGPCRAMQSRPRKVLARD